MNKKCQIQCFLIGSCRIKMQIECLLLQLLWDIKYHRQVYRLTQLLLCRALQWVTVAHLHSKCHTQIILPHHQHLPAMILAVQMRWKSLKMKVIRKTSSRRARIYCWRRSRALLILPRAKWVVFFCVNYKVQIKIATTATMRDLE